MPPDLPLLLDVVVQPGARRRRGVPNDKGRPYDDPAQAL